jgi:hypothetical protein
MDFGVDATGMLALPKCSGSQGFGKAKSQNATGPNPQQKPSCGGILWERHCRDGVGLRCRWRVAAVPLATKTPLQRVAKAWSKW